VSVSEKEQYEHALIGRWRSGQRLPRSRDGRSLLRRWELWSLNTAAPKCRGDRECFYPLWTG